MSPVGLAIEKFVGLKVGVLSVAVVTVNVLVIVPTVILALCSISSSYL